MRDLNEVVTGTMIEGRQIMNKARCIAFLIIAALPLKAVFADEAKSIDTGSEALPTTDVSLDVLLTEPKYASQWHLLPLSDSAAYAEDGSAPIDDLRFQDASTIARVSRMRKLSLLTLAQSGQTRLFLGVNEDGVVGVHFSAFPVRGDDDYIELVRMPYLTSIETADVD